MQYDISVTIRRPRDSIFAVLADVQDYIHRPGSPIPEMEKIPPGETEVGTRWREVVRLLPFVTMTMWSTVTALDPGRRLEESFRGPAMTGHIVYSLEPTDAGTVLRQRETLTPHGLLRLLAGPMDRMLRPRLAARLEAIKALLEEPGRRADVGIV